MRKPRGKPPSISLVMRMAMDTADALNIPIHNGKYLRRMISKVIPIPQVYATSEYRLWVDRYYIAFQSMDGKDLPVQYVYLSREHIAEERAADSRVRRLGRKGFLDAPTLAQFAAAFRFMRAARTGYATREWKPVSPPQTPHDLKTSWRSGHPLDKKTAPALRRERL